MSKRNHNFTKLWETLKVKYKNRVIKISKGKIATTVQHVGYGESEQHDWIMY